MSISTLVNQYGEKYSPYMCGIVNHLPMAQIALYKMTGDLRRVEEFTKDHVKRYKLDPVKEAYPTVKSIDDCLGQRSKYESYLDVLKSDISSFNAEEYVREILNVYDLGISSGLFHPLIRVKHAIDGYNLDKSSVDEIKRALSYYITSYRKGDIFRHKTDAKDLKGKIEELARDKRLRELVASEKTTGKKLRALYNDSQYLRSDLIVDGNRDEKVESLLNILLPVFINSGNLIALHCITGLEALLSLEDYYNDFNRALDIFTTTAVTHLMTLDEIDLRARKVDDIEFSWNYILNLGTASRDVHNIKFTYSCYEISKSYPMRDLKRATLKRVNRYSP